LGKAEVDILLVMVSSHLDPDLHSRLSASPSAGVYKAIDFESLFSLFHQTPEQRLSAKAFLGPGSTLVRSGLIQLHSVGNELRIEDLEVRPSESIVNLLLQRPIVSGMLSRYCHLMQPIHTWDRVIIPEDQQRLIWELVSGERDVRNQLSSWGYADLMPNGRGLTLFFAGPPGTGKTAFAHAIASRLGRPILRVPTSRLLKTRESLESILREIFRAAVLCDAVVVIDDCEGLMNERNARFLALLEALEEHDGLLILTSNEARRVDPAMARRITYQLDFDVPSPFHRERIWEVHLPVEAPVANDISVATLAATYEFTGAMICNTVMIGLASMRANGKELLTMEHLKAAAETQLAARFDDLAVRGRGGFRLGDLVLPEEEMDQIKTILDACSVHEDVLSRWGFGKRISTGRGICIMFDGPPGVGKTFAAEILASELKLPIYRVHIPNIVSKWVGETERNIAAVFQRARSSRAVLLFDEADSLFASRNDSTTSATDRYANMEVNLLLQEIERYDGVTVLTTNRYGSLDAALQRRIQFRLTFPFPGAEERARIWRVLLPAEAPVEPDLSFERIASRFDLSGGHIKNAMLKAAYKARSSGSVLTEELVADAAFDECVALGKVMRQTSQK
jgi:SpoVK/Ycf46/Vps4 family AAA+-type ATPase